MMKSTSLSLLSFWSLKRQLAKSSAWMTPKLQKESAVTLAYLVFFLLMRASSPKAFPRLSVATSFQMVSFLPKFILSALS